MRRALSRAVRKTSARLVDTDEVQASLTRYGARGPAARPPALRALRNAPGAYPGLGLPAARPGTAERDDIVFLTSRFRSGSTALWNAFRALEGVTAYYEPFNERRFFDPDARGTRVDATHLGVDDYWAEYDRTSGLAELYDESWIRRALFMDEDAWNPRMQRFVERLVECAPGRPVLQFNRIDFRLPWIRHRFPRARVVHLYRHPREQWCSFLIDPARFPADADPARFHDHFYLRAWSRDLRHVMPFLHPDEIAHPYQLFYLLWKASWLFGQAYADTSVAFEDLVGDPEATLGSLTEALDMTPAQADVMRTTLVAPKPERWTAYAEPAWFERHEAFCERRLDEFFG